MFVVARLVSMVVLFGGCVATLVACGSRGPQAAPLLDEAALKRYVHAIDKFTADCLRQQGFSTRAKPQSPKLLHPESMVFRSYDILRHPEIYADQRNSDERDALRKPVVFDGQTFDQGCSEAGVWKAQNKEVDGYRASQIGEAVSRAYTDSKNPLWKPLLDEWNACVTKQGFKGEDYFDQGQTFYPALIKKVRKDMSNEELDALMATEKKLIAKIDACNYAQQAQGKKIALQIYENSTKSKK
jgi:hypothetical protein